MKITCDRTVLSNAFQTVSTVVPTRTPKPVLEYVKLQAVPGQVTMLGTDSEVAIRYTLPDVQVQAPGEVLLPKKQTGDILREMQGSSATIEFDGEHLWIRGDRSEYELQVADPAEFPNIADFDAKNYHTVQAGALRKLIRRTVFACDVESTKYALGGVLFDFKGEVLTLVATDTRRLAVAVGACATEGTIDEANATPVVPSKAMSLLEKALVDDAAPVFIAVSANTIDFKAGNSTIWARLVEGRFPQYQNVIPRDTPLVVELVAGPFHATVRQSQIVTSQESRGVKFTYSPGLLKLTSQAANIGQSRVEMPVVYEGEEITVVFDPRYIVEFLKVLEPESLTRLKLRDSEGAALFETDDGYRYVVMPLAKDR